VKTKGATVDELDVRQTPARLASATRHPIDAELTTLAYAAERLARVRRRSRLNTDALKTSTGQVSAAVGGSDYGLPIAAIFAAANIVIPLPSPSTRVTQPEAVQAAKLEPVNA
jgi:hypothetical protein